MGHLRYIYHLFPAFGHLSVDLNHLQVLFSVGFEEDGDKLLLPLASSIQKVEVFLAEINKIS